MINIATVNHVIEEKVWLKNISPHNTVIHDRKDRRDAVERCLESDDHTFPYEERLVENKRERPLR